MPPPAIVPFALVLDALIGEPDWLWRRVTHPVVWMGRLIAALDQRLNKGKSRKRQGVAALALLLFIGISAGLALETLGFIAEIVVAAILLAHRSLVDHVRDVAAALGVGLSEGRAAVSKIVGRDPELLDEAGVARAAIESAAENFSDGVIAPAFWLTIAGLPGLIAYKLVNTADSMIGYRSERYRDFGWAAARFDDLINWPAARLSAVLLAFAAGRLGILGRIPSEAAKHSSPNAGWPEAAIALALGCGLAGPRVYASGPSNDAIINDNGRRNLGVEDINATLSVVWRAWALYLVIMVALLPLII